MFVFSAIIKGGQGGINLGVDHLVDRGGIDCHIDRGVDCLVDCDGIDCRINHHVDWHTLDRA